MANNTAEIITAARALRFGIELETVGLSRIELAKVISRVAGQHGIDSVEASYDPTEARLDDGRVWRVVPDASLSTAHCSSCGAAQTTYPLRTCSCCRQQPSLSTPHNNGEIVSPILTQTDLPFVRDLVAALATAGARADASCGIHIHIDGTRLDASQVARLAKTVAKQEKYLQKALAVSEERLGRYCLPVSERFLERLENLPSRCTTDQLNRAWYNRRTVTTATRYDQSRYHGLNLNSWFYRQTVEFRYFNGTLDGTRLDAYIQLARHLTAKAAVTTAASAKQRAYNEASAKYDFRVVLLGLGMIGSEYAEARKILLDNLPGNSAWKNGAPTSAAA